MSADVWSVTSWTELRRDGLAAEEHNFLQPDEEPRIPYVTGKLADAQGPIVATTDYESGGRRTRSGSSCRNRFATLGADGHGFSDTRAAARRYFHIDTHSIVVRALQLLAADGEVDPGRRRRRRRSGTGCSTSTRAPPATPEAMRS